MPQLFWLKNHQDLCTYPVQVSGVLSVRMRRLDLLVRVDIVILTCVAYGASSTFQPPSAGATSGGGEWFFRATHPCAFGIESDCAGKSTGSQATEERGAGEGKGSCGFASCPWVCGVASCPWFTRPRAPWRVRSTSPSVRAPPRVPEPTEVGLPSSSSIAGPPNHTDIPCMRCGLLGHWAISCPDPPRIRSRSPSARSRAGWAPATDAPTWRTYPFPDPLTVEQLAAVQCLIEEEQRQMTRAISDIVTAELRSLQRQIDFLHGSRGPLPLSFPVDDRGIFAPLHPS